MPIEWSAMARMPGSTPMPTARTNTRAKMMSGIARASTMIARAKAFTIGCGVVFAAARKAIGTESTTARNVPINAIHNVSMAASITLPMSVNWGGHMRDHRFARSPKLENSPAKVISMYRHPQTTATAKPAATSQRAARRRVIGGRSDIVAAALPGDATGVGSVAVIGASAGSRGTASPSRAAGTPAPAPADR